MANNNDKKKSVVDDTNIEKYAMVAKAVGAKSSVSSELARIQSRIARQQQVIDDARAKLRELRKEERKQKREDAREAARIAREQEQQEALNFWRMLHESSINQSDGPTVSAYEFVTDKVMPHVTAAGPVSSSDGEFLEPDDEL